MITITHFTYHPLMSLHEEAVLMPVDALQEDVRSEIQKYLTNRTLPTHVYMLEVYDGFGFYLPHDLVQVDPFAGQRESYPYDRLDAHTNLNF